VRCAPAVDRDVMPARDEATLTSSAQVSEPAVIARTPRVPRMPMRSLRLHSWLPIAFTSATSVVAHVSPRGASGRRSSASRRGTPTMRLRFECVALKSR